MTGAIRVAAVGDVHVGGARSAGRLRRDLEGVAAAADLLLLAGDLTEHGRSDEVDHLLGALEVVGVPMVGVLGNHEFQCDEADVVAKRLEQAGVTMLEGSSTVVDVGGVRVGVAGTKGFGGGFPGASASDFGEPEMKAFVQHSKDLAAAFEAALAALDADLKLALLHYAPIAQTLHGEPLGIHAFLGASFLGDAIDRAGAHLAVHGHAHVGTEEGRTPGGVPVRNVARPVLRRPFAVYEVAPHVGVMTGVGGGGGAHA